MNNALDVYRPADRQALMIPSGPPAPRPPDDRLNFRALIDAFRRQIRLFFAVLVTVMLLALFLTLRQVPLYSASSQVVLDTSEEQVAPTSQRGTAAPSSIDRTDTEVQIIRSREMARNVAGELRLAGDPEFDRPAGKGGMRNRLRGLLGLTGPAARAPTPAEIDRRIVNQLQSQLSVERFGETYTLAITYTSPSPLNAARIANEYARQFTASKVQHQRKESQEAIAFLASRLDQLRGQAQADTRRVQEYRIANNLPSTTGASLTEQEISSYNQAVATARAQSAEDRARLNTAAAQLRSGSKGDDVGEALESSVVGGLRARQAEVSGRLAALEARYGPRHPDVLRARSEKQDVDAQIESEIGRVISNLEAKARVSDQRLSSIASSLSGARGTLSQNNRAMVGLDDLQRRALASQELYESYLNRYKEVSARSGTERSNARIISEAEPPLAPSAPKPLLNLILALVIGSGLGIAAAFLAELIFSGLTTSAEVEERLHLPALGSIPALASILPKARSPIDAIVEAPMSGFAEAFRGLRTAMHYAGGARAQVIAITSAVPKEGKSTIAVCLARTIALGGERILLIDCDSRRRGVSRMFGSDDGRPGLAQVLRDEATLDDAIMRDEPSGAYVLPFTGPTADISELLAGPPMAALLEELRRRFTHVLIDTAPVLPVAETRVIATMADMLVFVVRWRGTADHAVKAALQLLPRQYVTIGGVVLSRVDMRKQARFAHGDANSYYRQYADYYS